jgi:hypothetical protein
MGKKLFVCQIYVDAIIFCSTNKSFYDEFNKIMTNRFEMSMMGVLTFFLGFQIKQVKDETSLAKRSILVTYSRSLAWIRQSPSKLSWALIVILILIWVAHQLIKRYIAP